MPTVIMVAISFTVILALSLTNKLTAPKISKLEEQNQKDSMHKVLEAQQYERNNLYYGEDRVDFYIAKSDGKILGYIFITEESGYGGPVSVMTAITPDGKIKAAYVLNVDDETPGLGKQAAQKEFYSQFAGLKDKVSLVTGEPKKDKNDFFASSKPQKKDGKKGKNDKKKGDEMGFFAKKAKKLAEKEANRAKSQKK